MVVARKKPTVPAPPTSRSSSSQTLPRTVKSQSTSSNLSTTSDTLSNSSTELIDTTSNGTTKSKSKLKTRRVTVARRKAKRSFLDNLFFLFLATIASYAVYTCPSDHNLDSPVCRSLSTYRTYVLEPYVIPPIRAAISHPIIVEPYEKYAKPAYESYIQPVTPYVAAAQRHAAPYVNSTIQLTQRLILRTWNSVFKVYWTRAVVPRYNRYVKPQVKKYVSPVTKRAAVYKQRVEPYIRDFARQTSIYSHRAQKTAIKIYSKVKPYAIRTYDVVLPHASSAYAKLKPTLYRAAASSEIQLRILTAKFLQLSQCLMKRVVELRRTYVDPPILRIWETIEKSGPSSNSKTTTSVYAAATETEDIVSIVLDDIPEADTDPKDATVAAMEQPTSVVTSTTVESIPSFTPDTVIDTAAGPETPEAPSEPTPLATPEDTLERVVKIAEESAGHASNVIDGLEKEIQMAEAEQVLLAMTPAPEETPVLTPVEPVPVQEVTPVEEITPVATVAHTNLQPEETDVEDVDDFLRELGLDDNDTTVEETQQAAEIDEQQQQKQKQVDEETKKAATAAKRADIVGRHVRWQSELDTLVKDLEVTVGNDIKRIRDDAAKLIGTLPSDKAGAPSGKGQEVLTKVETAGEKLLKGLEVYIKKLKNRQTTKDDLEKEKEKWEKVIDKVESRFKDTIRSIQEEVHEWYVGIREIENNAVIAASKQVKNVAERAQGDIGLDYAWLDDVTYYDWQKYHDLMRTFERFEHTVHALQNGTHENAPEDNLISVLDKLDHEMKDVMSGFAFRMNSVVREGDRYLRDIGSPEPEVEDDEDMEDEECEPEEPTVSILPISPVPVVENFDAGSILVGKNKEQVEQLAHQAVVDGRIEL